MATTKEEQEILVRGSEEHKDYLKHQFGRIKDAVNSFETRIAVAGRAMLLVYVVYITVKAGIGNALPTNLPTGVNIALLVLDILMLALQVLGLEGSVPGLNHLADELEDKGKTKEASKVRASAGIAQFLLGATAVDIVLQSTHYWGSFDITNIAIVYNNILFILRVVVIGLYLVAMAKLEHKGPKVISEHEAAKRRKDKEQEQTRMDNAAIQGAINQALQQFQAGQAQAMRSQFDAFMSELAAMKAAHVQADIQAITDRLMLDFQAKFQAIDQTLFRQNITISEVQNQAKRLPDSGNIQAKRLPEKAGNVQANQATIQARKQPAQGENHIIRLVPASASRDELITEAKRLRDVEGLSTYAIGERLGKSAKTVQSWLSPGKNQAEEAAI